MKKPRRKLEHLWMCKGADRHGEYAVFWREADATAYRDLFTGTEVKHFREVPPKPKGKKHGRGRKLGRVGRVRS